MSPGPDPGGLVWGLSLLTANLDQTLPSARLDKDYALKLAEIHLK